MEARAAARFPRPSRMALGDASLSPLSGSDPNPILRVRPQMFSRHRKPRSAPVDPLLGKPASFGIHRYIQGSSNLFEENRLLKFAIVGLFGITAVLGAVIYSRSEEHTSELQSLMRISYAVFCLK